MLKEKKVRIKSITYDMVKVAEGGSGGGVFLEVRDMGREKRRLNKT